MWADHSVEAVLDRLRRRDVLDEVLALGDRVAVMYEGRIVGILDAKDATRERVGLLMGGIVA